MPAPVPTALLALALIAIACIPALFVANHLRESRRLIRTPRWPFLAALVLGLLLTAAIRPYFLDKYRVWYVDRQADKLMAQLESQQPVYRTIREHEPDLYQAVRIRLLDGLKQNASSEELTVAARGPVDDYVQRVMPQVPDAELIQLMTLTVDVTAALATTNPQLCVDMIMGRPIGDVTRYMSAELQQQEAALLGALIVAAKTSDRMRLSMDEVPNLLAQVVAERSTVTGIPTAEFAATGDGTLAPPRACVVATEFLKGILALPPEQAAALFRSLSEMPG